MTGPDEADADDGDHAYCPEHGTSQCTHKPLEPPNVREGVLMDDECWFCGADRAGFSPLQGQEFPVRIGRLGVVMPAWFCGLCD